MHQCHTKLPPEEQGPSTEVSDNLGGTEGWEERNEPYEVHALPRGEDCLAVVIHFFENCVAIKNNDINAS